MEDVGDSIITFLIMSGITIGFWYSIAWLDTLIGNWKRGKKNNSQGIG